MAQSIKEEVGQFVERFYRAYSRRSTQVVIYEIMLEKIRAESSDPTARRLAHAALDAGKLCKADEAAARAILG